MTENLHLNNHVLNQDGGDTPWLGEPCEVAPEASLPCGDGSGVVSGDYENSLHFGDNLDVLRRMPAESVDLIYLDPPFNSNANYNVLYGTQRGGASQAQSHAFEDTWKWGPDAKRAIDETAERHLAAGALLDSFQRVFPDSNMMAYIAMMAVRLIEMHRVLKPTGSIYLHCDPTADHYLKVVLDAIFGTRNLQGEIIWRRTAAHVTTKKWPRLHDVILNYAKDLDSAVFNPPRVAADPGWVEREYRHYDERGRYMVDNLTGAGTTNGASGQPWRGVDPAKIGAGRHWRYHPDTLEKLDKDGRIYWPTRGQYPKLKQYLHESSGTAVGDLWNDIQVIGRTSGERIGYATQKPLALLKRIITASSSEGDVVLDPFCGCGTAIEAAEETGRRWIGIDITYLAIHIIEERLVKAFTPDIKKKYQLFGRPKDANDARSLAARDWLEFQKWAVFKLKGLPKDRPGADGGIDGIIRYHRVGIEQPNRAVVSVKGGLNVGVNAIHELKSVVKREGAEMGILVCLNNPGAPMRKEAAHEGYIGPPNRKVLKLQIITVEQLFEKNPLDIPGMIDPPEVISNSPAFKQTKRTKKVAEGQTEMLLPIKGEQPPPKRKGNRQIRPVDIEVMRPNKRAK